MTDDDDDRDEIRHRRRRRIFNRQRDKREERFDRRRMPETNRAPRSRRRDDFEFDEEMADYYLGYYQDNPLDDEED